MNRTFQIDDVFSSTLFGGNQLAVLPDAVGTDQHEHLGQSIAYARTNGVVPPWSKQATYRLSADPCAFRLMSPAHPHQAAPIE